MKHNKEEQSSVRCISNFVRGMFYETVLFDVSNAVADRRVFAAFCEPTWSWGVSWSSTSAGEMPSAVVYRVL